jgi:hypothetical protein
VTKRITAYVVGLVLLGSADTFAQQAIINTAYQKIHDHICTNTEMNVTPCPRIDEDDERWAFVTTWCARNSSAAECAPVKNLKGGPVVVAFDHRKGKWRAIYGVDDVNVDDVKGTPDIRIASGGRVVVVVEGTNPLLYTAEAGAITETDSPAIGALKALFEKLGPAIAKVVALGAGVLTQEESDAIKKAQTALSDVKCVTDQTEAAITFIRTVETDGASTYKLLKASCKVVDETSLNTAFQDLNDAVAPLRSMDFCAASLTSLITLLDTPAANIKKLKENIDAVVIPPRCATMKNPSPPPAPAMKDSPLQELSKRVKQRAEAILKAEDALASASSPVKLAAAQAAVETARKGWNDNAARDIKLLQETKAAAADAAKLVQTADALVEKKGDFVTALGKLAVFERKLIESIATLAPKAPTDTLVRAEIADFFVVPNGTTKVSFEKNRTRTLKVKESSPFAASIDGKTDVDTAYTASVLSASLFDMSVAITHTQLSSPVFGAVSEPAPTEADPNAKKNVIAKTDEEERSGQLAVFVSYPILSIFAPHRTWTRSLDLDLGVGTGEDLPAFFLGGSWSIGPIRIGAGSTWQQVKALDGQSLGDTVATKDDIKLKNELDNSWYAAFSFSLGETLSLFKK